MVNNWTGACAVNIMSAQLPSEFCLISLRVVFFLSCIWNAIFSRVGRLASEEVVISLLCHKCLPILLNGTEYCPLFSRNKHSVEFSVTKIFMKLFKTNSSPTVKECQKAFRFLPITNVFDIRTYSIFPSKIYDN
jgi:hypothetical protein